MDRPAAPGEHSAAVPLWRDERVLRIFFQILFAALAIGLGAWMISNLLTNYSERGVSFSFGFLDEEASFDLAEGIPFEPTDSYARAFLVGVVNTLRVAGLGIIGATIVGLVAGILRLSSNWLVSRIVGVYIEVVRNTPLLVQLFFLYFAVIVKLPPLQEAVELPGPTFLSNRGVVFPWPRPASAFGPWWPFVAAAVAVAAVLFVLRRRGYDRTGRPAFSMLWVLLPLLVIPLLGWLLVPGHPLQIDTPTRTTTATGIRRTEGGTLLSPEFTALLLGLVIYTGAFIAEVVRAGIQSVPKGQTEAARAVGLTQGQVLRLVVLPQALRVIIPPLISQYLNLTKNSSLAIGIGFLDLYAVSNTMLNQSGRVVEVFVLIMASYLTMSLTISAIMNLVNRRIQIVER